MHCTPYQDIQISHPTTFYESPCCAKILFYCCQTMLSFAFFIDSAWSGNKSCVLQITVYLIGLHLLLRTLHFPNDRSGNLAFLAFLGGVQKDAPSGDFVHSKLCSKIKIAAGTTTHSDIGWSLIRSATICLGGAVLSTHHNMMAS